MHPLLDQMPASLREIVGPFQTIDVPEQGATSDVVILSSSKGRFVVKRAHQPPYHEWLRREYEVLRSLSPHMDFIPKPFGYVEEELRGSHSRWLLMEHLPGVSLTEVLRRGVEPAERRRLLFSFGQALSAIHRQPVPVEFISQGPYEFVTQEPYEFISQEPWLDRILDLAAIYLRDYDVDGDAALLERLKAERPEPLAPCLIHGDYTLDNVLIDCGRVSGVIDWCWGAWGDPRYDLALATREESSAFQEPADFDAFYEGYAGRRLTEEEKAYFTGIYEFL